MPSVRIPTDCVIDQKSHHNQSYQSAEQLCVQVLQNTVINAKYL